MSRQKTINVPLFWKFSIIGILIVLVFGSINMFWLWDSVYQSFEKEINKRCVFLASITAEKVFGSIVYENDVSTYTLINEIKKSDPSIAYIFLLDEGERIIAQAEDWVIPTQLIEANKIRNGGYSIKVIEAKNFESAIIRDIAFPILQGKVGTVRLGIIEEDIINELSSASKKLLLMILLFLAFGLGGAFFFSYLISSPIKYISKMAQDMDLNTLEQEELKICMPKYKRMGSYYFEDELDLLVSKFNLMMVRLKDSLIKMRSTRRSFVQTEKLASIGTLTSGIGHEINNPISGIQNCINRIMKDPSNTKQNQVYMELIKEATGKIERVVQQLLNFSRKQDIKYDCIRLLDVIKDSVELTRYRLDKNSIKLSLSSDCNLEVQGSINHLGQVFLNLILNAIDAIEDHLRVTPTLQGEISIRMYCLNEKYWISIRDNGIGIPLELQDKIFDPFFTTKEIGKGTGLGLYVSYGIIKEHRGELVFKSEANKGTDFIVSLPLSPNNIDEGCNNPIKNTEVI